VMSRDLIDLAMMDADQALLHQALDKAKAAYGKSVAADLDKAIEALRARPHRLDRCMEAVAPRRQFEPTGRDRRARDRSQRAALNGSAVLPFGHRRPAPRLPAVTEIAPPLSTR